MSVNIVWVYIVHVNKTQMMNITQLVPRQIFKPHIPHTARLIPGVVRASEGRGQSLLPRRPHVQICGSGRVSNTNHLCVTGSISGHRWRTSPYSKGLYVRRSNGTLLLTRGSDTLLPGLTRRFANITGFCHRVTGILL